MKRHLTIYIITLLGAIACSRPIERNVIAGYISPDTLSSTIAVRHPDSLRYVAFAITENTEFGGGAIVEGNIAEVVYTPSSEVGMLPQAVSITADKTYPRALGRWTTRNDAMMRIDIELLPYGKVRQYAPTDILTYTSWRIAGEENIIELCGTLLLPPEKPKVEKGKKPSTEPLPRRLHTFCVKAQTDIDGDKRVLTILNEKQRKSRLYSVE